MKKRILVTATGVVLPAEPVGGLEARAIVRGNLDRRGINWILSLVLGLVLAGCSGPTNTADRQDSMDESWVARILYPRQYLNNLDPETRRLEEIQVEGRRAQQKRSGS